MIELRPYKHNDALALLPRLHPISRSELGEVHLTDALDMVAGLGHATTGWRECRVMFVGASVPLADEPNTRGTVFMFSRGYDNVLALGLRMWAQAERKAFPNTIFRVDSKGNHPLKHRFLATAGCQPVGENLFVA